MRTIFKLHRKSATHRLAFPPTNSFQICHRKNLSLATLIIMLSLCMWRVFGWVWERKSGINEWEHFLWPVRFDQNPTVKMFNKLLKCHQNQLSLMLCVHILEKVIKIKVKASQIREIWPQYNRKLKICQESFIFINTTKKKHVYECNHTLLDLKCWQQRQDLTSGSACEIIFNCVVANLYRSWTYVNFSFVTLQWRLQEDNSVGHSRSL